MATNYKQLWGVRCNLIFMWTAAVLVAWLFRWAAIHAPPVAQIMLSEENNVVRADTYSAIDALSRVVHGVVFFMLVNLKALYNVFSDLQKRL